MSNPYKGPSGHWRTKALFFETNVTEPSYVVYTLKEQDHNGYPSLYRLYMETNDPTEYRFATSHLGGWSHWQELLECGWFRPHVEKWRKELEVRMKSQSLARIMAEGKGQGREAFAANKYLVEKGWEPKENQSAKRGRPSKEEIAKAAKAEVDASKSLEDDFARIQGIMN